MRRPDCRNAGNFGPALRLHPGLWEEAEQLSQLDMRELRPRCPQGGDWLNTLLSRLDAKAREAAREDKERDELEISHGRGRETTDPANEAREGHVRQQRRLKEGEGHKSKLGARWANNC